MQISWVVLFISRVRKGLTLWWTSLFHSVCVRRVVRPRLTIYVCQESQQTREQQVKHENGDASANTFFGSYTYGTIDRWSFKTDAGGLGDEQLGGFIHHKMPRPLHDEVKDWSKIKRVNSVMEWEKRTRSLWCSRCFSNTTCNYSCSNRSVIITCSFPVDSRKVRVCVHVCFCACSISRHLPGGAHSHGADREDRSALQHLAQTDKPDL